MPLYHLDLYRLTHPEQFAAAGLEEYLRPNGVTVIEWAQNFFGPQPRDPGIRLRWVKLEAGRSETERHITYEDLGA
jgi:tRNA A37 threonylcarbamoyladenosine biosynthesis protein TsaE